MYRLALDDIIFIAEAERVKNSIMYTYITQADKVWSIYTSFLESLDSPPLSSFLSTSLFTQQLRPRCLLFGRHHSAISLCFIKNWSGDRDRIGSLSEKGSVHSVHLCDYIVNLLGVGGSLGSHPTPPNSV